MVARFDLLLFGDLALLLLGNDWRTALHGHHLRWGLFKVPCARSTSNQPGLMVSLVLVFLPARGPALCYRGDAAA